MKPDLIKQELRDIEEILSVEVITTRTTESVMMSFYSS